MPQLDLLSVGEAFDDLIFHGLPRLPRPGEEIKTGQFTRAIGGGAVITAIAAARLGLRCALLSALGPDAARAVRAEGVAVRNLLAAGESAAVSIVLSTTTNRTFVTFNGVNDRLEGRLLESIQMNAARHVHLAFNPTRCARWRTLIVRVRTLGITTSWDFGWNPGLRTAAAFPALAGSVDYLFLNEQEARYYARVRSLSAAFRFWRRGSRNAIVKLGRKGSVWLTRDGIVRAAAMPAQPVDTTGAGDAFNAGFLTGILRGDDRHSCLRLGNIVGALSTRAPGGIAGLPHREELRGMEKSTVKG